MILSTVQRVVERSSFWRAKAEHRSFKDEQVYRPQYVRQLVNLLSRRVWTGLCGLMLRMLFIVMLKDCLEECLAWRQHHARQTVQTLFMDVHSLLKSVYWLFGVVHKLFKSRQGPDYCSGISYLKC
jgi:hypothetical protein